MVIFSRQLIPILLAAIAKANAQCSLCEGGFDPALADFEVPNSGGYTCASIEAASAVLPPDSPECGLMTRIQGFCCPKCYMCGSAEDDAAMSNAATMILPSVPLTCMGMAHFYHMLSYPSTECPANPADLDTSMFPEVPGVSVGFNLREFCGCPGFDSTPPESPVCSLCPEGQVMVDSAEFVADVFPNVTYTCEEGAKKAPFYWSEDACAAFFTADNQAACCETETTGTDSTTPSVDATTVDESVTTTTAPTEPAEEPEVPSSGFAANPMTILLAVGAMLI